MVEGVPTRGAGLIKQFFSPSGRKAKELFQYIAQKTGIDLAQDATLARFTMELYNDARAKSLLDGLPTSKSGILNKAIDNNYYAIHPRYNLVNQELINHAHDNNIKVNIWTINSTGLMKKFIRMGVDGLITDSIQNAKKALDR